MGPHLRRLHDRLGAVAAELASTEDDVADTFERIAGRRPSEASRLGECAASARDYAAHLRRLAARYGADD